MAAVVEKTDTMQVLNQGGLFKKRQESLDMEKNSEKELVGMRHECRL